MIAEHVLDEEEIKAAFDRAWEEVFGRDGCKDGSIHQYTFLAHRYVGEKRLEKLGQFELFRKSQQLPEYRKAEEMLKQGWGRWMSLEYGIRAAEARDKLKIRQYLLLRDLRLTQTREPRREILRSYEIPCGESARRGDDVFFRKLGPALNGPPRTTGGSTNYFTQVSLAHWLTGFWWLMPLKAVAADMAQIQGEPAMEGKYLQRLKKLKSPKRGEWSNYFHSANQPLIDCIEKDGSLLLNALGKQLLT